MPPESPRPAPVCQHCLEAHERITDLLERAREALARGEKTLSAALWAEGTSALAAHMDAEERHMLPKLLAAASRSARVMVAEHNHLRAAVASLAGSAVAPAERGEEMRRFVEMLRAHQRHELSTIYAWADDALDPHEKTELLAT